METAVWFGLLSGVEIVFKGDQSHFRTASLTSVDANATARQFWDKIAMRNRYFPRTDTITWIFPHLNFLQAHLLSGAEISGGLNMRR